MGRSESDAVSPDTAREVCQRTSGTALFSGSIATRGSQYVLGLNAMNCRTGDILAQAQVQGTQGRRAESSRSSRNTTPRKTWRIAQLHAARRYATPTGHHLLPRSKMSRDSAKCPMCEKQLVDKGIVFLWKHGETSWRRPETLRSTSALKVLRTFE
jgi:hypothetical protein